MNAPHSRAAVIGALVAAALLWGLSFVATKIALGSFDQFTLVFARFVLASLIFITIFFFRGFPRLDRKTHGRLLLIALFEPVLYFLAETAGLDRTTAAKASLIIATIPGVVLLFSRLALGERTGGSRLVGALVSIVGVIILVAGDPNLRLVGLGGALGDLLIVGAVLSAAFYMILTRGLAGRVAAFEITAMQFIYGMIIFAPIYAATASRQVWESVSGSAIGALVYLVIGATIGAFLCYNYALTKIEVSRAAVYINAIPIVTTVAGWVILGERMTAVQAIGAAIVLVGIYTVSRKRKEPAPAG